MSIRFKVILPYLILTLVVAVTGVYVVTRLVANSLQERLVNQLLEAGRVVSDGVVERDSKHIETLNIVAYTRGVADAVAIGDGNTLRDLVMPTAGGLAVENLIVINREGQELFHMVKVAGGAFQQVTDSGTNSLPIVRALLEGHNPDNNPLREMALAYDGNYYYFTAVPMKWNDTMVGVMVVGTRLSTLLPYLKNVSLADLILYKEDGQVIGTTMIGAEGMEPEFLKSLAISVNLYQDTLDNEKTVKGENFTAVGRTYSLARGPLKVGNDRLGVFAVVLPRDFVAESGENSRYLYVLIYAVAVVGVVLIGYGLGRLIIKPLYSLVLTSQAIAKGDLTQRTGIRQNDEIGVLATSFDTMTENLQERTLELERTNRLLAQMDRTKVTFISISAHELRTPLTLISGYSQILEQRASRDPDLAPLAKGILEGSSRMTEIVNSMLDVSRIDNQTLQVVPEKLEIKHLITNVRDNFEEALTQRHLTLTTEGLDTLPPILADPDLLFKVFYHIVMNAIKYTPDGRWITISGRLIEDSPEKPEVEIVVSDSGIGIDAEHLEVVFEKFFQIGEVHFHSSGKTKFKGGGPGLGLAIARGIVLAHNGSIWAESPGHDEEKNPGSKFFVRLPVNGINK